MATEGTKCTSRNVLRKGGGRLVFRRLAFGCEMPVIEYKLPSGQDPSGIRQPSTGSRRMPTPCVGMRMCPNPGGIQQKSGIQPMISSSAIIELLNPDGILRFFGEDTGCRSCLTQPCASVVKSLWDTK